MEKLLWSFGGKNEASSLAQRRVLTDLGVASQPPTKGAAPRAGGQPLSGRRSKPQPAAGAPKAGGGGGGKAGGGAKVSDGDLLTSMVQRLNGLEKKMAEQRAAIVEKDAELAELRARVEEKSDDARLVAELTDENIKLKRRQLEMEKFLADYGLSWVGDDGKGPEKKVETELVPLAGLGQGQEGEAPALGRKLGDGSYVPTPQGGGGGGGGAAAGEGGGGGSDPVQEAARKKEAAAGTIAAFDLEKILRHIKDLNYLAGDGSAQTAQRADGAHVLVEMDPLPLSELQQRSAWALTVA